VDLVIENSGPSIASLANQLLTDAYGPRFSVRIVTQREQANGRLIECFDISVIDAESGLESSILQKSGGESCWLDKALTDAVGLFHQESAGINFDTLFSDEVEDGLTADRKMQFYRMDRAALELGGYSRKYFISHNPDAWDLADWVIDLANYKVTS
jgi:exonuclease SbcC